MDQLTSRWCQCGEVIWDYHLLWNSTSPRFSRCFLKTIPTLLPTLFLVLLTPLEVYFNWYRRLQHAKSPLNADAPPIRPIPVNLYNLSRFLAVGVVLVVCSIQFGYDLAAVLKPEEYWPRQEPSFSDFWWSVGNFWTFALYGFILHYQRRHGVTTSGLAWVFAFLALVLSLPSLYMYLVFFGDDSVYGKPQISGRSIWNSLELVLFLMYFTSVTVIFLLSCFADQLPTAVASYSNKISDSTLLNNSHNSFNKLVSDSKKSAATFNGLDLLSGSGAVHQHHNRKTSKRLSIAPEIHGNECPEIRASFLSRITFWWFTPLAIRGYRKSLTMDDLWRLNREETTSYIAPRVDRNWIGQLVKVKDLSTHYDVNAEFPSIEMLNLKKEQVERIHRKNLHPGVVRVLYATFGLAFLQGNIFKLLQDLLTFLSPFLLKIFIDFVATPEEPLWHGFALAVTFFVIANAESLFLNYYFYRMFLIGARMQAALISAIYRKSLQLSNGALRETTTGEIVNLMSVDAQRFVDLMPYLNLIWSAPLRIILLIYFIYCELGPSVFAGVAVMALMVPINWYFTAFQRKLQMKQMIKKDERVKVIGEMLTGMRVIKLYGWEVPFIKKISCIRDKEIVQLREIAYINTVTSFIWTCAPFLVSFFTFAIYVLSSPDHILDAKKAFVTLSLFNLMQFPLSMLPRMITSIVMLSISVRRLDRFFNSAQLENYVTREENMPAGVAVSIENGTFAWEGTMGTKTTAGVAADSSSDHSDSQPEISTLETETEPMTPPPKRICPLSSVRPAALTAINLTIKTGSLVAVVGHVGSGKSSLLSAILGDMERRSGRVSVERHSQIAYVAQQAWIRNASLKENILFGAEYVKSRYEAIIEMCALKPDIAILPGGDETEIGEKGINLSGGQKQRVAIARACYSSASIVLFDDPLSAVDSHVARHIFSRVISSASGYLADRTRVLVTNNIALLPEVDCILVLENGMISEQGTYTELMASNGHFAEYIREFSEEPKNRQKSLNQEENEEDPLNSPSKRTKASSIDYGIKNRAPRPSDDQRKQLIKLEHTETGEVKAVVYFHYFRSLTYFWLAMVLVGYVGIQLSAMGSNVWLAIWSNDGLDSLPADHSVILEAGSETNSTKTITQEDIFQRNSRLVVFGLFGLFQGIFVLFAAIAKEKAICHSSVILHRSLLESIMRSPMQFFDTTPLGRIVNRFSKDIDSVDHKIPHTIHSWLMTFLQVTFTLVLIVVQVPVFMVVVVPIILMYHFIQKFYVATSRQLKRLESVTRSPIYSHFSETLSGVSTIRAFGATRCFIGESNYRMDANSRCYYPSFIDNRWLAIRLELLGNLVVFFTAIFSVLSRDAFTLQPGFIGLIMTYSLQITQTLNWLVRMTSEMETNVVSVERIGEYCENAREREWTRAVNQKPVLASTWPDAGRITFVNYSVRYRDGLDLVLKELNIEVQPGEKIGIVGRTGSGKSTLTLALFRLLEAADGAILIDGVDISQLGLHELRSKLSIIPQDPVLFSGTIRSNLDPFKVYTDDQLWQALEHCHLRDYITAQEEGLEYPVAENGVNLSVGQRQLICLGRALLRHTKILVLDEATAAIDLETDALIQKTIRAEFSTATVLTIAHRLHTILDSTRILVLDKGRVVEFDAPQSLLADAESKFYALAKDAGLV